MDLINLFIFQDRFYLILFVFFYEILKLFKIKYFRYDDF